MKNNKHIVAELWRELNTNLVIELKHDILVTFDTAWLVLDNSHGNNSLTELSDELSMELKSL